MIEIIQHGSVREIRMNRPPANALNPELIAALREAVEKAPGDGVRALVLSGTPGRFSGGLDVPFLMQLEREAIAATWQDLYRLMGALATSPIPIAAAITGHSPAGGAVLGIFCDTRFMVEGDFKIGLNEVQVGIPLPPIIFRAFRRLLGPRQAERLAVSGTLIVGSDARAIGLVDELVPADRVVERAIEWCNGLLALPPQAMSITRQTSRADLAEMFGETEEELAGLVDMWFSEETQRVLKMVVERLTKKK